MFEHLRAYPEARAAEQEILHSGVLPEDYQNSDQLFDNAVAQPLICLYQIMVWSVIVAELPPVDLFAGYSLGELSAYYCAGMLSRVDLLRLAGVRGRLMSKAAEFPQSMVAVLGLKPQELEPIARANGAYLAIQNGLRHLIFGLPLPKLQDFQEAALASGATRVVPLPVNVAAHTPLLAEAAAVFQLELEKVPVQSAGAPVLAGTSADKIYDHHGMISALTAQIHHTIDWHACQETALSCGCNVFLELGPGGSLVRMLRDEFPNTEARALGEFHDLKAAAKWAAIALQRQ